MKMEKVGVVYRTNDYDGFKRLEGNRGDLVSRARKVTKSIEAVGWIPAPIVVNEKFEVIDGQARVEACKQLGHPIDFVVIPGIGYEECRHMNTSATIWKLIDYIESYAEKGNENYIYLRQLIKAYKKYFDITVIYNAATRKSDKSTECLKDGTFKCGITEYNHAVRLLEYEKQFVSLFSKMKGPKDYYFMALAFCYEHPDIDNNRMREKVEQLITELRPVVNIRGALEELEAVYNNRIRGNKVYLKTDYLKCQEGKYVWYRNKWMKEAK